MIYRLLVIVVLIGWALLTVALLSFAEETGTTLISIRLASEAVSLWLLLTGGLFFIALFSLTRSRRRSARLVWQFEMLSEALNEGVMLVNGKGRVRWHNEAAEGLLNERDELDPTLVVLVKRAQTTGGVVLQTMTLSEEGHYSAQVLPLQKQTYAIICRPAQGNTQNTFYENFIRRIVHDMRNPLAAIIGHASNLSQSSVDDPQAWRKSARTIEDEAQRLTRLVDSMLFDARLAYVPLQLQPLDLSDLLEEAIYAQDERALREGKTLQVDTPGAAMRIEGDRDLLVRAFENLIDNSLKYSGENGRLQIRLEDAPGLYRIRFEDNGEGIPPEYLPDRIFQPLVRARSQGSGSGLGLSIVRKIIEMHGGTINAQSRVGAGTTMVVELPKE